MIHLNIRKAAFINFIFKYSTVIIQLLLNFILARLISSQEFGVVAIITVFISFFSILSDMGIGTAIIQFKDLDNRDYEDFFSFTILLGIILSILFVVLSNFVALIYKNDIYLYLGLLLSISVFFNTVNMVPNALFYKEQMFFEVGLRGFVVTSVCATITVVLAINGFSYYSIIFNSVFISIGIFIWNLKKKPIKPHLLFRWNAIRKIASFSSFQFLFSIINYFARNTDTLLIGYSLGEISVGLYDKGYKLMTYPMTMFSGIITPILHPILSNFQNDIEQIYAKFIKLFEILFYFSIVVSVLCFFAPKEIVRILYGNNWDDAIFVFKILSLSLVTQMCNSITGSIFQSLGKTKLLFVAGCLSSCIIVSSILIGVCIGTIESTAFMVMIGYNIIFWTSYYLLITRGFNKNFSYFCKEIYKPYLVYILMLIIVFFINIELENMFISLTFKCLIVIGMYLILLLMTGQIKKLKHLIKILMRRPV